MSTRGFVGFRKNNQLQGWYNHSDSYYEQLGNKVLEKFKQHTNKELVNFYSRINFVKNDKKDEFYNNHKTVFDDNWNTLSTTLQDDTDFLKSGEFCEYGYVFNLDDDTIEVYKSYYYDTEKVLTVTRKNIDVVKIIFDNEIELAKKYNGNKYWEENFIKTMINKQKRGN